MRAYFLLKGGSSSSAPSRFLRQQLLFWVIEPFHVLPTLDLLAIVYAQERPLFSPGLVVGKSGWPIPEPFPIFLFSTIVMRTIFDLVARIVFPLLDSAFLRCFLVGLFFFFKLIDPG